MIDNLQTLLENTTDDFQQKANILYEIMTDIGLNDDSKLVGILYLKIKYKFITLADIEQYNNYIKEQIKVLLKLDSLNYSQQDNEAENLRKMFFAITKDIRTIMLKIALIVTYLRSNLDSEEGKQDLAHSILTLYAPLSARLGLSTYKTELENGAFKILYPEKYDEIQTDVDNRFHKRQPIVDRLVALVKNTMESLNIEGKVYGRKKHIYSIYKKLLDHPMDKIYDLIAVRCIVKTIPECYALLGKLHSEVEPMQKRFKDYIATPKPNGYQSLHTTVIFEGFPVEIQIRTEDMHKYAEYGIAAHWMYKEKRNQQTSLDTQLAWLRQMMEAEESSIDDLATSLNQDIYNNEIFVQTPMGKVVYLPNGSTPIDFAYSIHSEVGNRCVGAKVNGKMVPTTSSLNNGDTVEIITNPHSKGPSRDWLKIVKTSEAKSKINAFFKKNMKESNIKLGKSMLENAIRERGFSASKLLQSSEFKKLLDFYNFDEEDELFANIGTGAISANNSANRIVTDYQRTIKIDNVSTSSTTPTAHAPNENDIYLKDMNNVLINFAGCCHPMYGDDIIGFVSAGRGIIIHRAICPNVSYFHKNRIIEAYWKEKKLSKSNDKKKNKN